VPCEEKVNASYADDRDSFSAGNGRGVLDFAGKLEQGLIDGGRNG